MLEPSWIHETGMDGTEAEHEFLEGLDEVLQDFEVLRDWLGLQEADSVEHQRRSQRYLARKIGRLAQTLSPLLQRVAPIAAQETGRAIAGAEFVVELPFAEAQLNRDEGFREPDWEPLPPVDALSDALAAIASQVASDLEAHAYTGACIMGVMPVPASPLHTVMPQILKGATALARLLRRSPRTRPLVRTVPSIVVRTLARLARRQTPGMVLPTSVVANALAVETQRVLGDAVLCARLMLRSAQAVREVTAIA